MARVTINGAESVRLTEDVKVVGDFDVCVVGGGPAGVFAAVRAARLGASVCLVEQLSALGGTSAMAQVNEWHSIHDIWGEQRIVGGLIYETLERLRARKAVTDFTPGHRIESRFNSAEMSIEFDLMLQEAGVRSFLVTTLTDVAVDPDYLVTAVVVSDSSGRRAIRAKQFIDASGNGALLTLGGFGTRAPAPLQPVSFQYVLAGLNELRATAAYSGPFWEAIRENRQMHAHPDSDPWINAIPNTTDVHNVMGARLNGIDASDPDQLSAALIEGRRLARAFLDLLRDRFGRDADPVALVSFAPLLGIRQTRQARALHQLTEPELMSGSPFHDTIAVGVYPVDIHHAEGTVLRHLDGWEDVISAGGGERQRRRWRDESLPTPRFYTIPFRSLVPEAARNVLAVGRLIDATAAAYGAVRVVVVCAQFGEAAGIAAALSARDGRDVTQVDVKAVQAHLRESGTRIPQTDTQTGPIQEGLS